LCTTGEFHIEVVCRPAQRSYNASRRFKEDTALIRQQLDWSNIIVLPPKLVAFIVSILIIDSIDACDAQIRDSLKGRTVFLSHHRHAGWLISTTRCVDAHAVPTSPGSSPTNVGDLFLSRCRLPDADDHHDRTFVFKLHEATQRGDGDDFVFVEAINTGSGVEEECPEFADQYGWPCAAIPKADEEDGAAGPELAGEEQVMKSLRRGLRAIDPWRERRKGLVVCDRDQPAIRIKYESPHFGALKRLERNTAEEIGSAEVNQIMLDMVRTNDRSDLLDSFPHLRTCHNLVANDYTRVQPFPFFLLA
jgi:hypothetical protein